MHRVIISHLQFYPYTPSLVWPYIDGLVQDCSNSIALAMELLQSCTKPSIYTELILYREAFR